MAAFSAQIKVRRPTMEDVSAVLALMLARNQAEYGEMDMTEEHIRNFWQASDFNVTDLRDLRGGLLLPLDSTATRSTCTGAPLWLHGPRHQG